MKSIDDKLKHCSAYIIVDEIHGKDLLDEETQAKSKEDKVKMIVAARKTLGPKLEDIDRSQRIAAERAIKDRASLLAEMDSKKCDTGLKMRGNEKRVRDVKVILEQDQAARETVERLERERNARLQQEHSRRSGGRMQLVQPQDRAAIELVAQAPFMQRHRTQPNIHVKIARSIAQVSIELRSAELEYYIN